MGSLTCIFAGVSGCGCSIVVDSRTAPGVGAISCGGTGPVSFSAPGWSHALAGAGERGRSAETWIVVMGVVPEFCRASCATAGTANGVLSGIA